jgi:hypothetical protein
VTAAFLITNIQASEAANIPAPLAEARKMNAEGKSPLAITKYEEVLATLFVLVRTTLLGDPFQTFRVRKKLLWPCGKFDSVISCSPLGLSNQIRPYMSVSNIPRHLSFTSSVREMESVALPFLVPDCLSFMGSISYPLRKMQENKKNC